MQYKYSWVFVVIALNLTFVFGQENLIPNPGFEDHQGESVLLWEHAKSPFYHYAQSYLSPHSGNNCLGLCVWKYDPTEYLQIELSEKLEAGSLYEIKLYIKYDSDLQECFGDTVNSIGCYFSETKYNIKNRVQLFFSPQIVIPVGKNINWMEVKEEFVAAGNEKYLIIGKYFDYTNDLGDSALIRSKKIMNAIIDSIETEKANKLSEEIVKIKKKYEMDFSDFDKIRSKKKQAIKLQEFRNNVVKMGVEIQAAAIAVERKYKPVSGIMVGNEYCHVRFYLDDISLTKSDRTKENVLKDTIIETGKVFQLKNVFFDFDKSELLDASFTELNKLFTFLNNNGDVKIEISGHTDNTGTETHNQKLSEARAKAVCDYLIFMGIDKSRLSFSGYGSLRPVVSNATEEGKAKNRRVEFILK